MADTLHAKEVYPILEKLAEARIRSGKALTAPSSPSEPHPLLEFVKRARRNGVDGLEVVQSFTETIILEEEYGIRSADLRKDIIALAKDFRAAGEQFIENRQLAEATTTEQKAAMSTTNIGTVQGQGDKSTTVGAAPNARFTTEQGPGSTSTMTVAAPNSTLDHRTILPPNMYQETVTRTVTMPIEHASDHKRRTHQQITNQSVAVSPQSVTC